MESYGLPSVGKCKSHFFVGSSFQSSLFQFRSQENMDCKLKSITDSSSNLKRKIVTKFLYKVHKTKIYTQKKLEFHNTDLILPQLFSSYTEHLGCHEGSLNVFAP